MSLCYLDGEANLQRQQMWGKKISVKGYVPTIN